MNERKLLQLKGRLQDNIDSKSVLTKEINFKSYTEEIYAKYFEDEIYNQLRKKIDSEINSFVEPEKTERP